MTGITARYLKAYISLGAVILFFSAISLLKGARWKPLLIPSPLFVLLFAGITYQYIKERRATKKGR
ncbi:hypothetical protein [Burkholderia seminalis]|uniref:hypothetical protein n=1 Tax=Burkholderia seminalis TaxID=488731 RepID=UPI0026506603|nr:hypothetical protein [Burkholderia seminalis]MDN7591834.1 hypothetical protein [Burkholderia seminalis]